MEEKGCNGDCGECFRVFIVIHHSHCNVFAIVMQKPFLSINSLLVSNLPKTASHPLHERTHAVDCAM
jgi:hypothetical protein